jgi:hypothetical protein
MTDSNALGITGGIQDPAPGWYRDTEYPDCHFFIGFDGANWLQYRPTSGEWKQIGPPLVNGRLFGYAPVTTEEERAIMIALMERIYGLTNCLRDIGGIANFMVNA